MMHYMSIHQPSNRCSLRMLLSVWSEAVVVKLLRDFLHFNVMLDIHEKQMDQMPLGNRRLQTGK